MRMFPDEGEAEDAFIGTAAELMETG